MGAGNLPASWLLLWLFWLTGGREDAEWVFCSQAADARGGGGGGKGLSARGAHTSQS